jgi:hypothetical protein
VVRTQEAKQRRVAIPNLAYPSSEDPSSEEEVLQFHEAFFSEILTQKGEFHHQEQCRVVQTDKYEVFLYYSSQTHIYKAIQEEGAQLAALSRQCSILVPSDCYQGDGVTQSRRQIRDFLITVTERRFLFRAVVALPFFFPFFFVFLFQLIYM